MVQKGVVPSALSLIMHGDHHDVMNRTLTNPCCAGDLSQRGMSTYMDIATDRAQHELDEGECTTPLGNRARSPFLSGLHH
jgi:hypothetical protein